MEAASVYLTLKGKMTSLSQLKYQKGSHRNLTRGVDMQNLYVNIQQVRNLTSGKLKGHRVNL